MTFCSTNQQYYNETCIASREIAEALRLDLFNDDDISAIQANIHANYLWERVEWKYIRIQLDPWLDILTYQMTHNHDQLGISVITTQAQSHVIDNSEIYNYKN